MILRVTSNIIYWKYVILKVIFHLLRIFQLFFDQASYLQPPELVLRFSLLFHICKMASEFYVFKIVGDWQASLSFLLFRAFCLDPCLLLSSVSCWLTDRPSRQCGIGLREKHQRGNPPFPSPLSLWLQSHSSILLWLLQVVLRGNDKEYRTRWADLRVFSSANLAFDFVTDSVLRPLLFPLSWL